ncbi:hypothetical protein [Porticoccus sp.]
MDAAEFSLYPIVFIAVIFDLKLLLWWYLADVDAACEEMNDDLDQLISATLWVDSRGRPAVDVISVRRCTREEKDHVSGKD